MDAAKQILPKSIVRTDYLETPVLKKTTQRPVFRRSATPLTPLPRPRWLPESVWPFESRGLEVNGCTIAVTEVGRGPALLFVHTGMWSFIWRDVMIRLSSSFRCICLDAPGNGLSARLPGHAISLENSSRAVAAVIEQLDLENLTLVFHDLGGPASIAGAARSPERVRGIAAVNTFAWKPSGALFRGMLALMGSTLMREFDVATGLLPRVASSNFGAGRYLDQLSRAAYRAGIGPQGLRAFHYYLRDARHCDALYERAGAALTGPFQHLPLLTIFGERNDPLKFQQRWKGLFPAAQQVVVPKGNHYPMCDDPDLVARTIRTWHTDRVAPTSG